jgi:hypothetical protein
LFSNLRGGDGMPAWLDAGTHASSGNRFLERSRELKVSPLCFDVRGCDGARAGWREHLRVAWSFSLHRRWPPPGRIDRQVCRGDGAMWISIRRRGGSCQIGNEISGSKELWGTQGRRRQG